MVSLEPDVDWEELGGCESISRNKVGGKEMCWCILLLKNGYNLQLQFLGKWWTWLGSKWEMAVSIQVAVSWWIMRTTTVQYVPCLHWLTLQSKAKLWNTFHGKSVSLEVCTQLPIFFFQGFQKDDGFFLFCFFFLKLWLCPRTCMSLCSTLTKMVN